MLVLAREIVAQAGVARSVIAVDGQPDCDLERVAQALVRALESLEVPAMAAAAPSSDADALRSDIVQPFRSTGAGDGVLVVHGHGLLASAARTLWRWSLWVEQDDGRLEPRADVKLHASAIIDASDPDHPRRNWNDAC